MSEALKKQITTWSTDHLLEQRLLKESEYGPEAIALMDTEVAARKISAEDSATWLAQKNAAPEETTPMRLFPREEFTPFDHLFSQIDILLVRSILTDAGIPFYIDNPQSERVLPIESQTSQILRIHVHRDSVEKAHTLIDEHFVKNEGAYQLKYTAPRERLRVFSFNDISIPEAELHTPVDVSLSTEESAGIVQYAQRLVTDIDHLENERIVFFYDNIEDLLEALKQKNTTSLSRILLLTILEVLQIYCDDPDFPPCLDEVSVALIGLFSLPA